jgi:hypothetical protein
MSETADVVDRTLASTERLIRYFAPGFAAIFIVAGLFPESQDWLASHAAIATVLGVLLGILIYSINKCVFQRLVQFVVLALIRTKSADFVRAASRPRGGKRYLDEQRWLRRESDCKETAAIQKHIDEWGAMLNFLYGLLMTLLVAIGARIFIETTTTPSLFPYVLGCMVLAGCVVWSEFDITDREIQLSSKYPDGKLRLWAIKGLADEVVDKPSCVGVFFGLTMLTACVFAIALISNVPEPVIRRLSDVFIVIICITTVATSWPCLQSAVKAVLQRISRR